jgi:hypothetical protein
MGLLSVTIFQQWVVLSKGGRKYKAKVLGNIANEKYTKNEVGYH